MHADKQQTSNSTHLVFGPFINIQSNSPGEFLGTKILKPSWYADYVYCGQINQLS